MLKIDPRIVQEALIRNGRLSSDALLISLLIARSYNAETHYAQVTQKTLARESGLSRATVTRVVSTLTKSHAWNVTNHKVNCYQPNLGFLFQDDWISRQTPDNQARTCLYTWLVDSTRLSYPHQLDIYNVVSDIQARFGRDALVTRGEFLDTAFRFGWRDLSRLGETIRAFNEEGHVVLVGEDEGNTGAQAYRFMLLAEPYEVRDGRLFDSASGVHVLPAGSRVINGERVDGFGKPVA